MAAKLLLFGLLIGVLSLPSAVEGRVGRPVPKVRLCGDQLVGMLRMICQHHRAKLGREHNTLHRRGVHQHSHRHRSHKKRGDGLGDRCCRSACKLSELYAACWPFFWTLLTTSTPTSTWRPLSRIFLQALRALCRMLISLQNFKISSELHHLTKSKTDDTKSRICCCSVQLAVFQQF